jgi:hypothetical protein
MTTALMDTEAGPITVELFDADAPGTVANFVKLANDGFYDGLSFHRVIDGFMAQGGCPNSRQGARGQAGTGGPGYTIPCEINRNKHQAGSLSMAHAGKNTGGNPWAYVDVTIVDVNSPVRITGASLTVSEDNSTPGTAVIANVPLVVSDADDPTNLRSLTVTSLPSASLGVLQYWDGSAYATLVSGQLPYTILVTALAANPLRFSYNNTVEPTDINATLVPEFSQSSFSVTATDTSTINTAAGTLAIQSAGKGGVSAAMGVSAAKNEIGSRSDAAKKSFVRAIIEDSTAKIRGKLAKRKPPLKIKRKRRKRRKRSITPSWAYFSQVSSFNNGGFKVRI